MKKLLLPIVAMVTLMLLFPANAALSDNTQGVDGNGNKNSTSSDCTSLHDKECNSGVDPFVAANKKDNDGKKKIDSTDSECTSLQDGNCNSSAEAASTPD